MKVRISNLLIGLTLVWYSLGVLADEPADTENPGGEGHEDSAKLEELVVRAHPLSDDGVAQSLELLEGVNLERSAEATIGDTLRGLPGVRSSGFGPAVGRPVIHGLQGSRVKTMTDRVSTMDLSLLQADHAVTIDSYLVDSIELIKGPSAMIYGTETIGGLINIATGRVPNTKPDDGVDYRLVGFGSDNAERRAFAGRLQLAADDLVFHADLTKRESSDFESPACLESHYYMEREEEEHHHEGEDHDDDHGDEHDEHDEISCGGAVPNSFVDVLNGSLGASLVNDRGHMGFSVTRNGFDYGIPVAHSHGHEEDEDEHHDEDEEHHDEDEDEHEHEEEHEEHAEADAFLTLTQTRYDFDLRRNQISDAIEELNVRVSKSDYEHDEIDGHSGEVETTFKNDALEMRFDLKLARTNPTFLAFQFSGREYQVGNDENPLRPVTARRMGVSWLYERPLESSTLEFSSRAEYKNVKFTDHHDDRSFTNYALSLGLVSEPVNDWVYRVSANSSSRAPVVEELSSTGFHFASNAIELGNPQLDNEVLNGITGSATKEAGRFESSITAYARRFNDFIYLRNTGEMDHGAPVFLYHHTNATFTGLDLSGLYHLSVSPTLEIDLRGQFDTVKVNTSGATDEPLPQLPANRAILGIDLYRGGLFGSLNYTRSFDMTDTAAFELPTDAWTDVSGMLEYRFDLAEESTLTVYLKGKNLTDQEQRNHVSIVKDLVPLPGRMLEFGFRLSN